MNKDVLEMLGNEEEQVAPPKEDPSMDESYDKDLVLSMMTADGEDGNFTADKPKEDDKEESKIKIAPGKIKEKIGKYGKDIVDQAFKNPNKFTVETVKGKMTLRDAIMKGWNPKTGEFDKEDLDEKFGKMKADLNDADRDALATLTDPANAGFAPADAEQYGIEKGSPMIHQPTEVAMGESAPAEEQSADGKIPVEELIGGIV